MIKNIFSCCTLLVLLACSKSKEPVIEPAPLPPPGKPAEMCSSIQIEINPEGSEEERDTVFLKNLSVEESRSASSVTRYTYQDNKISKKEVFDRKGQLQQLYTCSVAVAAEHLLYMERRSINDPGLVMSKAVYEYSPTGKLHYVYRHNTPSANHSNKLRVLWNSIDKGIDSVTTSDSLNYPVYTTRFTYDESISNPFYVMFPFKITYIVQDPSLLDDEVKIGLMLSQNRITKITSTKPGFQAMNITYTYNARNLISTVAVNGVTKWKFTYLCN